MDHERRHAHAARRRRARVLARSAGALMHNVFQLLHAATEGGAAPAPDGDRLGRARESKNSRALAEELPYLHCGEYHGFGPLHLLADDTMGYAFCLPVPVVDTVPE